VVVEVAGRAAGAQKRPPARRVYPPEPAGLREAAAALLAPIPHGTAERRSTSTGLVAGLADTPMHINTHAGHGRFSN
jgi:hypothetical protein